jgi:hypothetical protein
MGEFQPVLNSILSAALVGTVVWIWGLWKSHTELRLKVAEHYTTSPAMDKAVAAAVAPLQVAIAEQGRALAQQGRMIERIAERLHVPAVSDD